MKAHVRKLIAAAAIVALSALPLASAPTNDLGGGSGEWPVKMTVKPLISKHR